MVNSRSGNSVGQKLPLFAVHKNDDPGFEYTVYCLVDPTTLKTKPNAHATSITTGFFYVLFGKVGPDTLNLESTWSEKGFYAFFHEIQKEFWPDLSLRLLSPYLDEPSIRFAWFSAGAEQVDAAIYVEDGKALADSGGFNFRQVAFQFPDEDADIAFVNGEFHITKQKFSLNLNRFTDNPPLPDLLINTDTVRLIIDATEQGVFKGEVLLNDDDLRACNSGFNYYIPGHHKEKKKDTWKSFHYPIFKCEHKTAFAFSLDLVNPTEPENTWIAPKGKVETHLVTTLGKTIHLTGHGEGNGALSLTNHAHNIVTQGQYCLSPTGSFTLHVEGHDDLQPSEHQLLCGLAGTESIAFVPDSKDCPGDILHFDPKHNACAPVFPLPLNTNHAHQAELLTNKWVTSWAQVRYNGTSAKRSKLEDLRFLSQPKGSPLFKFDGDVKLLGSFQPTTANLKDTPDHHFPLVPYSGVNINKELGDVAPEIITAREEEIADFEHHIISPTRKMSIEASVANAELKPKPEKKTALASNTAPMAMAFSAETVLAKNNGTDNPGQQPGILSTSPQGLLVELDSNRKNHNWKKLVLAQNHKSPTDFKPMELKFENLTRVLQSAFQTDQQFLVISLNKKQPGAKNGTLNVFDQEMNIEGWPFLLDIPTEDQQGNFNNILIFKFCKGRLQDRVKNPNLWTNASDFNSDGTGGLSSLSTWLTSYIDEAGAKSKTRKEGKKEIPGDPDYSNFINKVTDEHWNGVLALRTDISLTDFPPQLQGLLCGIEQDRFKAHHFGINSSHITVSDEGAMNMDPKSSMFALIDYEDPRFESYHGDIDAYKKEAIVDTKNNYDYKVLQLKVLFENSKITDFQSHIQLVVNQLFKDHVLAKKNNNLLILNGSYEDHNGVPVYIFNERGDNQLALDNKVLTGVEILKAAFTTIVPTKQEKEDRKNKAKTSGKKQPIPIHARFSLWGYMNLEELPGFDLFSFGSSGGLKQRQGLAFSNLGIELNFDLNKPTEKTFTFNPSHIAFDTATSTPRPAGLFPHFPLKIIGLAEGNKDNTISSLGYLDVELPDLKDTGGVSGDWYGLIFDINMGTLGALAAAGGFKSNFMAVWGVGKNNGAAAALKLPGVNTNSKMLSLQGVMKLDIAEIKLLKGAAEHQGEQPYLMLMNDIALKFFGIKLPPGGNIDFYLFGDPHVDAKPGSLGWYASYLESKG